MQHSCLPHDRHPGTSDCSVLMGKLIATVDHLVIICYSLLSPTALLETFWLNIRKKKALIINLKHSAQMCVLTASFSLVLRQTHVCHHSGHTVVDMKWSVQVQRSELTPNSSAFKELFSLMIKTSWVLGLCEHLSVHSVRKRICLLACLKTLATY